MNALPRVAVTLVVVLLALLAGWWLWHFYMISPWTRDARVRADVVTIAPDVSGWVVELKVRDNQQVKVGDLLMSIDRERYQAALDKARALAETRRQQLNLRQHEASRRAHLGPQAISAELRENAQINAAIARAELQQAEAEVKLAELNLSRSEVRAPRSGQVTNLHLAQGNFVQSGQAVMALVADDSFYVQAYFEETKLPGIRVGAPAEVILMSGSEPLRGKVQSISRGITDRNAAPDAQLLANVEPTFNWVRLAQRIPVRIELEEVPQELPLSAGMTASVRIMEAQE
ncbi:MULTISPECIES: efflux RND transporter periplasmic adaptor subunit [unclassified Pseudomonas]|uniref:efflux RND transporter periplasmic adaptor subunit n=1 Tax=unclassified Pseudomonas TaxID=196821 RepID=UPI0024482E8C|nr:MULTISPECIES: efflux RND transporter periplasmic adaptor subunit [unclassified Pseudomonas]MDG9922615.1 efflux RND transporter periplasmic adaptor subunit [Pseudomonas sp. GD04045]MDH0033252.1 efflux RND transporter periplasmic adaptor subunit [Pseudomonas sp. GD04019]